MQDAAERDRLKGSTFQALALTLGAVSVYALVQLFRMAASVTGTDPRSGAMFRGLQLLLAGVGALSLASVNLGEKQKQ